jgi:hypothetical protein
MFAFGRQARVVKQLPGIIRGAMDHFDKCLATVAALKRKSVPDPGDRYLVILLGFADAAGQIGEVDMETTRRALKEYLSSEAPDANEIFTRMMQLSNDRRYFEWQMLAGRVLTETLQSGDKDGPMIRLATTYLED